MMKKIIMICAIIIGVAGLAGAAPTTLITFDEFSLGTAISNQYASQGVIFSAATYNLPVISMNGAMPAQPILRPDGGPSTYAGDFWMQFTTPVLEVQFDSGCWDGVGNGVIKVYDPGMSFLGTLSNTGTGVQVINISGMGPVGYIYFNSIADGGGADIDNLGFTPITVQLIEQLIEQLIVMVDDLDLEQGIDTGLVKKLQEALNVLTDTNPNNDHVACNKLNDFIDQLEGKRGKAISEADTDKLIAIAQGIIDLLAE